MTKQYFVRKRYDKLHYSTVSERYDTLHVLYCTNPDFYSYLPKRMSECARPEVLRKNRRNGILIIPKSARLLNRRVFYQCNRVRPVSPRP